MAVSGLGVRKKYVEATRAAAHGRGLGGEVGFIKQEQENQTNPGRRICLILLLLPDD
jgi:hypothetical protein